MLRITLLFTLVPVTLWCQTNVDRLVQELDFLGKGTVNSWKYSTDFSRDPTGVDFNDAGWKPLQLNESLFIDSCWIRRDVVLPERIMGEPIRGRIRFVLSVDDFGYLWINGQPKGRFPWDGDFELTTAPKAGQRYTMVIKAVNTGGPLRLIHAAIKADELQARSAVLEDLALSFRVGQKLLSFDTYQTSAARRFDPGIDRSSIDRNERLRLSQLLQNLALRVDVEALKQGRIADFETSVSAVRNALKPIGDVARRFTLVFNSNAHIDAAWLWRERETIEVCKNTFTSVLDMMDARPDFTYTQSSAAFYRWMQDLYPDVFERLRTRVRDGRWEVVGGMWIEPDCNLPSGESWMRHLLYAKRYFRRELGVDVKLGWNPDSFGYNWNMPQLYRAAGIDAFITQKIGWNDTNVFPHRVFWWEGPDGSRVLSYFPFDYVNEITDPYRLADWMRQFEANTGLQSMLVLFGVGDHGGGPSDEMLDRIERLKRLDVYPTVRYATAGSYIDWLKQQDLSTLPVWKDELYLEYHRGTLTTQAQTKASNRKGEALLTSAERFAALAMSSGQPYPAQELEDAWRILLFNQFHDILPGSSIREVYVDAAESYREMMEIGETVRSRSLKTLARAINTTEIGEGTPVVVFNPLAWQRKDVVRVPLPDMEQEYVIADVRGRVLPSQIVRTGRYTRELEFIASDVPSLGYATYVLKRGRRPAKPVPQDVRVDRAGLENQFFSVRIDTATGWLESIIDKRDSREILSGPGNRLQLLEDLPKAWDAWNIGWTGTEFPTTFRGAEIVEQGPVRVTMRITHDFRKPGTSAAYPTKDFPTSFFVQDVTLWNGIDRMDFRTNVDWWEDGTMLKVAFPLTVSDTSATYEIPYGHIQRTTLRRNSIDSAKFEVAAHRWADLSDSSYGVSLLNTSKYGYDVKGSVMRLSLLRSPRWPDPTADRGKHTIEYALYPHAGRWDAAHTVRRGYELNNPLICVLTDVHRGSIPLEHSFVQLEPDHLVLTTIKKAEDSRAWIVQWYNVRGKTAPATLTVPQKITRAVLSNALEEDGEVLTTDGPRVTVPVRPHAIVTLKLSF
jgi:alpha-mannosidase